MSVLPVNDWCFMFLIIPGSVHAHDDVQTTGLEPLAEVEGALLVVEVLHLPHPQLLGLLGSREHYSAEAHKLVSV